MSGKFTHYLVTRFNVPAHKWQHDKSGNPTLDKTWLQDRLGLFNRFCVPSIKGQTENNFRWLIYCDIVTETDVMQQIKSAVLEIPQASIKLLHHLDELLPDLRNEMSAAPTPFVISSRLDNDDGLSKDFIRIIQAHFRPEDSILFNYKNGLFYDNKQKILTRFNAGYKNHFGSLIESNSPGKELMTIFGFHHTSPPDEIFVEDIDEKISWVKIIHSRNARSQLKGKPVFSKRLLNNFTIPKEYFRFSVFNVMSYILKRGFTKLK
jgi:hypothetical protein